jgi:hypothetical protein
MSIRYRGLRYRMFRSISNVRHSISGCQGSRCRTPEALNNEREHLDSCQTPISAYGTPISVYCDVDTDIGADFNDIRYQCNPISCLSDIGYTRYRRNPISGEHLYRHNIAIHQHQRKPDIGYTRYRCVLISDIV